MDKTSLILLVLFILATVASAVFLAINVNHNLAYHDDNSKLLSILWAVATVVCIVGVVWILIGRKKGT
jgi:ABC-type sugar transport system permease subunit